MRIKDIIGLALIFGGISLSSCTKFEEGPGFSMRTRTNRVRGVWTIQSYTIDGADSLAHKNFETLEYVFGGSKCDRVVYGRNCPVSCNNVTSEWQFSNNNVNHIWFVNMSEPSPFIYKYSVTSSQLADLWEIRRLTNKEMILQSHPDLSTRAIRITLTKENNDRPCQ